VRTRGRRELGGVGREIQIEDRAAVGGPIAGPTRPGRELQSGGPAVPWNRQPERRVALAVEDLAALGTHQRIGDFKRGFDHGARLAAGQGTVRTR